MFVPLWLLCIAAGVFVGLVAWSCLLARGRNPLSFPDRESRIFAASSDDARDAVVTLLAMHGLGECLRFDTPDVRRSILWDGTIINPPVPR